MPGRKQGALPRKNHFNERAIKAYEKAGFRRREVLEKSLLLDSGEYVDMLLMELTRDQWTQPGFCQPGGTS